MSQKGYSARRRARLARIALAIRILMEWPRGKA
jgi:hypothetical protein